MKRSEIILMVLQVPIDLLMLLLAGLSAYYLRFTDWAVSLKPVMFEMELIDFLTIVLWVSIGWLCIFAISGLYSTNPNRKFSHNIFRIVLACSSGLAVVALYIMFTQQLFDSRFLVAAGWFFAIVYTIAGRMSMRGVKSILYRKGIGLRRVAVVGSEGIADSIIKTFKERPELGYKVVGGFKKFDLSIVEQLKKLDLDEVIFTNPRADRAEALEVLDFCNQNHIVFKYSADLFATYAANMSVHPLAGVPIVELRRTRLEGWGRVIKRAFDVVLSCLMIVLSSPVMLLAALAIFLETGKPVIYRNERVGIRGKIFFTLKFRSMYQEDCTGKQFGKSGEDAEVREKNLIEKQSAKEGPIYKVADDPRVTRFGKFIRRFSIDELPQFFNVLRGEMSIVGPRPHQPREVAGYENKYKVVFTLKPGITGLAQISGRSDLSFEEEMKLDVLYIESWSLIMDVIILLKTPFVLFKKRRVL